MTEDLIKKLKDVKQALVSKDMTGEEWEEREEILEKLEKECPLLEIQSFILERVSVGQIYIQHMLNLD